MVEPWLCKRLNRTPLFKHLSIDATIKIVAKLRIKKKLYKKKDIVAFQNTPHTSLLILLDGQLIASMTDSKGKKVTVEYLDAPRLIAPAFLFSTKPLYPVDIEVINDATIVIIPKETLLLLLSKDLNMLNALLNLISDRTHFLSKRLLYLTSKSIEEKVIHYIRDLYFLEKAFNLNLPLSITELSELFAITRPALSRVLKQLKDRNILNRSGRMIVILDPAFFGLTS